MKKKDKDNSSIGEINPYEVDKLSKVPSWLIILFLKYWAAAAAVFFGLIGGIDIGISFEQSSTTDPFAIMATDFVVVIFLALILTIFINYPIRLITRLLYNRRNNTYKYNMVNTKGFKSFIICLGYILVVSVILYLITLFLSIHGWVLDLFGTTGGSGVEPFTYAFCFIIVDSIFLIFKYFISNIYQRVKYKRLIQGE